MISLVTGANGFLGSMLCRKLTASGQEVRGLVRATSDLSLLEGVPIQKVIGTLNDFASLQGAMQGVQCIYHTAAAVTDWGSLEYFREVNVEGTRRLLDAAAACGRPRFVYISTVAVHSFIDSREMDETSPQNQIEFPYCITKREAEALVMDYHQRGLVDAVIVRPGDIYGPGDRVVLQRLGKMLKRGWSALIDGGEKLGAFAYVENLADGILLAGTLPQASGRAYVLTDGVPMSWKAFFSRLNDALGFPQISISVPSGVAFAVARVLEWIYRAFRLRSRPPISRYLVTHLSNDFFFRIDRARNELGYDPKIGVDEAMRRTADWYLKVAAKGR